MNSAIRLGDVTKPIVPKLLSNKWRETGEARTRTRQSLTQVVNRNHNRVKLLPFSFSKTIDATSLLRRASPVVVPGVIQSRVVVIRVASRARPEMGPEERPLPFSRFPSPPTGLFVYQDRSSIAISYYRSP